MKTRTLALITLLSVVSLGPAAAEGPKHAYDDSRGSNAPNYGWNFASAPGLLEGDWTENGGFRLRVKPMWADLQGRVCNRRHMLERDGTYLMVCEEKDPTYGRRLWGIYMRPWEGERWQFATSRPAPNLEALTSGDPDSRTWYTYRKSAVEVASPPPVTVSTPASHTPASSSPTPPPSRGDATFTNEELQSFKVDNRVAQPPQQPHVWWIEPHPRFERRVGGSADGEPLYICRTRVKGTWVTGSVKKRNGSWCRVVVNGKERKRVPFEHLLKRKGDPESLFWAPMKGTDPTLRGKLMALAYKTDGTSICAVPVGEDVRPGHLTAAGCAYGVDGEARLEPEDWRLLIQPPKALADQWNR